MNRHAYAISIIALGLLTSCGNSNPSSASENSSSSENNSQHSSSSLVENISSANDNIQSSSSMPSEISSSTLSGISSSTEPSPKSSATSGNNYPANYNAETGALTDSRNGKVYKTAKIGNQIWMAENLNIDISEWDVDFEKDFGYQFATKCPKASTEDDCNKYGRLYTKSGFLLEYNNVEIYDKYPTVPENLRPFQGVCPVGWHIPSIDEWQDLFSKEYLQDLLSIEDGGTNKSGFNIKIIGFAFYYEGGNSYETSKGFDSTSTIFATVDQVSLENIAALNIQKNFVGTYSGKNSLHYAVRCLMN